MTLLKQLNLHKLIQALMKRGTYAVSPSGVSGISAFPFRTCRSLDEL